MPTYTVTTTDDANHKLTAEKYTIDDKGTLHLYNPTSGLAAFAPGRWSSIVAEGDADAALVTHASLDRYTVTGMVADAASGKRVAYLGRGAHYLLPQIEDEIRDKWSEVVGSVSAANGRECATFTNGGMLSLYSTERGLPRGVTADVVVLDGAASRDPRTLEHGEAMAKARKGEVVRA